LEPGDTPYREDFAGRCRLERGHAGEHALLVDDVTVRWGARVTFVGHVLVLDDRAQRLVALERLASGRGR
jgi:hypothetical protein